MVRQHNTTSGSGFGTRVLLLLSVDGIGGARLPCLLSKAGYRVSLLAPRHLAAHQSRYITEHLYAQGSPVSVAAAAKETVEARPGEYDLVLFGDEPILWAAADDPGVLAQHLPFPCSDEFSEVVNSKNKFLVRSREIGLNVPKFEVSDDLREAPVIAKRIGFPLLIKPVRGMAGSGLMFANDLASLEAQISRHSGDASYAVQEAVPGKCGSTSVLYDRGRPVCWLSYFMSQTWPNRFGSACVSGICDHADVEIMLRGVGAMTRFHGLGGIDWIWHEQTGRLVLLEFNPRPTPVYHLGPHAGVDFAGALADWRDGKDVVRRPTRGGDCVRLFPQNLYRAADERNPLEFLRTFGDAPWSDSRLMLAHLRRVATHCLPQQVRQRARELRSAPKPV